MPVRAVATARAVPTRHVEREQRAVRIIVDPVRRMQRVLAVDHASKLPASRRARRPLHAGTMRSIAPRRTVVAVSVRVTMRAGSSELHVGGPHESFGNR